jgi:glycosyltransferase involved in cell wall biosynthesis
MTNLQVGDNDLLGKRFNGHSLQLFLNSAGVISKQIVWKKYSDDKNTFEIEKTNPALYNGISKFNSGNSLQNIFFPDWITLTKNEHFLNADIVHFHLLHNASFNLSLLPLLTKLKPSVWTLHDPWALTGHCIHPFDCERWKIGCGDCPNLETEFRLKDDTSALNWEIKKDLVHNSEIDIIVASKWMLNLVENSPIFNKKNIHLVPFGLDLNLFKPQSSEDAKQSLGVTRGNIVIGFRASQWKLKGLSYVKDTLNKLRAKKPITLVTFNEKGLMDEFKNRYQVIDLGWVDDEIKLVQAYNATDIFLMPSLAEAFGMMAMETMACGKPSIVFDGTALTEVIHHPQGGIAVSKGNTDKLTSELEDLINNENKRKIIGENAFKLAQAYYNKDRYVNDIISIYKEVTGRRNADQRTSYLLGQLKKIHTEEIIANRAKTGSASGSEKAIEDLRDLVQLLLKNKFSRFIILKIIYPIIKMSLKLVKTIRRIIKG